MSVGFHPNIFSFLTWVLGCAAAVIQTPPWGGSDRETGSCSVQPGRTAAGRLPPGRPPSGEQVRPSGERSWEESNTSFAKERKCDGFLYDSFLLQNKSRELSRLWSLSLFTLLLVRLEDCSNLRSNVGVFVSRPLDERREYQRVQGRGTRCLRPRMQEQKNPNYLPEKHTETFTNKDQMWSVFSGNAQSWKLYRTQGNGKSAKKKKKVSRLWSQFLKTF